MEQKPGRRDATTSEANGEGAITPDELERERIRTYLYWAEVDTPPWYWPTYVLTLAVWGLMTDLGRWWGLAGSFVAVVVFTALITLATRRSGVTMPRFSGMPAPLRRAYLPLMVAVAVVVVGVVAIVLVAEDPPYAVIGIVAGLALASTGEWVTRRYRAAARELRRRYEGLA